MRQALGGRGDASAVLLFAPAMVDVDAVAEGAAGAAGDVPVAGCSTAGVLSPGGDDAVLALALGGDGLSVSVAAAPTVSPREGGVRAAASLGDVADRPHRLLLLFADGPSADHAEVVLGAYSVAGAGIPLAGGVAGHPLGTGRGTVLHGASALRGAVVGVAIGSDAPLGVGVAHGCEPLGPPMLVTAAAAGRVLELDGRPALEVYRERTGLSAAAACDETLAFPLARHGRDGPAHVRTVERDGGADGGLSCALEAGSLVSLMQPRAAGSGPDVVNAAAGAALAALDGDAPQALLAFDCSARQVVRRRAGQDPAADLARLGELAGGGAVAAISTHGEIARTRGVVGLHHQSLVVVAVG
ncbi:MAG TPA: FIST N-terminal domain-containing protein [Baekduia sp.]|nr:FIST N-terminal domain-containing protein [Baekduia sp.]